MKFSMEVDLTPKEARKLMGLPDVEAMQEKVVDLVFTELKNSIDDITDVEKLWQRFMPLSGSFEQLGKFVPDFAKFGSNDDDDDEKTKKKE